jgi:hypothetical protein
MREAIAVVAVMSVHPISANLTTRQDAGSAAIEKLAHTSQVASTAPEADSQRMPRSPAVSRSVSHEYWFINTGTR